MKRLLALLLVISVAFSLIACGNAENEQKETTENPTTGATEANKNTENPTTVPETTEETAAPEMTSPPETTPPTPTEPPAPTTPPTPTTPPESTAPSQQPTSPPQPTTPPETTAPTEPAETLTLVTGSDLSTARLGLGDTMYDFTVTKPDGSQVKLSNVLKEKKVAVLNFWYTTCTYCVQEFPLMQAAYAQYSGDAAIIALDPLDSTDNVKAFQSYMGLTFDMAACPYSWASAFDVQGFPTTIVVDRYGKICLVEVGAVLDEEVWFKLFEHFTADDYEQVLLRSAYNL